MHVRNARLRLGHAPGHIREAFNNAFEVWLHWKPGEPEPVVEFEINREPSSIPISRACTLVWNCTDTAPGDIAHALRREGLEMKSTTYDNVQSLSHFQD
ncbi:hypothetical protein [Bradyrhizobium yuanmingense]|uniref:hypothetical protein n=1 Tax=Bradyrhizobium yuanmingense TaxID=108015 RepID=UPI001CD42B32|nr:hypothetical protein [Bradyrhizobium yuanmingense]MCA1530797.1 hypothetical protein [Bradyrhizobium yuanmingense]